MFKKIISRAFFGFISGVCIGQVITIINVLLSKSGTYSISLVPMIIQFFMTGLIGLNYSASSIIFEIDKWGMTKQTIIHFLITSSVLYVAFAACKWVRMTILSTLIWFGICIVIYVIFWVSFFIYFKIKIKETNKQL